MSKQLTQTAVRKLIAQYEVLTTKEREYEIPDLVSSWQVHLEPHEKALLTRYNQDKNQLELDFEQKREVFKKELAGNRSAN